MTDATAGLIARLAANGKTIAVAESLTGGLLAAELIRPTGASAVVVGGVVAYATEVKHSVLGVDAALLEREGPVHPDVARQLAAGARRVLAVDGRSCDIGISTTGVAGPDGQGGREPGTVFIGMSTADGDDAIELSLEGSRDSIRAGAVDAAIRLLCEQF